MSFDIKFSDNNTLYLFVIPAKAGISIRHRRKAEIG